MRQYLLSLFILPFLGLPLSAGTPIEASTDDAADLMKDPRVVQAMHLLDFWVEAKLAYDRIPGVSLGLVHDQDLLWSKGYGFADVEERKPATSQTIYSICSISKLFTSVAVMQQKEAGKLSLDVPVSDYLPWFSLERVDADAPPVTLRGILTHSAGLPRESDHSYWTGPDFPFPTRDEVVQGLSHQRMLYPSDRFFQYSNLGITLAGQVVEKVSGESYESYVEKNILKPLGLKHTTPFLPEAERGKLMAQGYGALPREGSRPEMPFFQAKGIAPAAGYASNVEDLARFASWQFRLLGKNQTEVLNSYTLREMQRVHWVDPDWKTTWGLGFVVRHANDETWVGHGGSCPGFRTELRLSPKRKLAGIAMVNAMSVNPGQFVDQTVKIVGAALEQAKKSPGEGKPLVTDFEKYTGLYRSAWGEEAVVQWDGGLALVPLPSGDPLEAMEKFKHESGHVFRRIREDSDELGEALIFYLDDSGRVLRLSQHGNYSEKVQ